MIITSSNLFSEVKYYQKMSREFQEYLLKYPLDWPKFQPLFNSTVEKITKDILQFEEENIEKKENKVYKLKFIFEKRYRKFFLYGEYPRWVYEKPYGYAGDFKIIDSIYKNSPATSGFDRLWDNYFLQMTASQSTRERKDILKKYISEMIRNISSREINIMNLAAGPAREIKELIEGDSEHFFSETIFDCYDFDSRAISYATRLLNNMPKVNFIKKNAIRLALKKDISREITRKYDLIYSVGLLDYFDKGIATKLITNLRKILKKNGIMLIANFGEKYKNSSAGLMEWATEWYLIYRTEDELRNIFLQSGFERGDVQMFSSSGNIIQFCLAKG